MTQKLISKISVDYNFVFTSFAWLCVLDCFLDYCVVLFEWQMLSFHNDMIYTFFLWGSGQCRGKLPWTQKSNLENKKLEHPHWSQKITEYTFKGGYAHFNMYIFHF